LRTTAAGFECRTGMQYDMPVVFGPSELPQSSRWGWLRNISVDFVTDYESVRPLVPADLTLSDEPVVTFCRRSFNDVDYLGGRGYEEMCIGVGVTHEDSPHATEGTYWLVLWVDDLRAATVGREIAGWPKLGAKFSPVEQVDNAEWRYSVSEYGNSLISATVRNAEPLDEQAFDNLARTCAQGSYAFCSRHFEAIVGGDGVSQLTRTQTIFSPTRAFVGAGSVALNTPDSNAAPHSARIMATLAALPLVRALPAIVTVGSLTIDRTKTTALTDHTVKALHPMGGSR
jgi:acetoacetate decarboxylase